MKLLFLTSLLPENEATSGYEIANRALLHGLRALGHTVVAIGFANPGKSADVLEGTVNLGELAVTNADVDLRQKLVWLKRALQNNITFAGAKLQLISNDALIANIEKLGHFDGVIVNGAPVAAAFEAVFIGRPFIYIAHNVEWQAAEASAKAAGNVLERTLFAREAKKLKALECRLAAKANHVFTLSGQDSLEFAAMGAISVSSVPLIVELIPQKPVLHVPKWDAGLIGTWSWAPNRIGLDWFLNAVTPHLPDNFTFAIAGKLPNAPTINHKGGTIIGRVPSATEFALNCASMPLVSRAGTGVQLKTLEAFELGLPSVATSSSIRGISNLPQNCIVEDDPKQFANALVHSAKSGSSGNLDGSLFHASQKAQMLSALDKGLLAFQKQPLLEAAE